MKNFHAYTKLGSKAPYAWAVYAALFLLFAVFSEGFQIFALVALFFLILFVVQVIVNLVRLIKKPPKFNVKKVAINIVLAIVLFFLPNLLKLILFPA